MRPLELELDVYQGPFDLLLTLILKEEVDLLEISVVEVIAAYLEAEGSDDPDWEETTEFLLLMSILLEAKSRLLLPGETTELPEGLTPGEVREQLIQRLADYARIREAALHLRRLGYGQRGRLLRPALRTRGTILPPEEDTRGTQDATELARALSRVVQARREPDSDHIAQLRVTLRKQMRVIRRLLSRERGFSFERVFGDEEPLIQAMSLFALLELLTKGRVDLRQPRLFGDIKVRSTGARHPV